MDCNDLPVGALGDLGLFGIQGKRHVGKLRNRCPKGLVDQDLLGCICQPVLSANNMGDPVAYVIHGIGKDIQWFPIGTDYDKIL